MMRSCGSVLSLGGFNRFSTYRLIVGSGSVRILYFLYHDLRANPTTSKKEIVVKAFDLINDIFNLFPTKNISKKSNYKTISRSARISLAGLIYEYYINPEINPNKKGLLSAYQESYHTIIDSVYPPKKPKKATKNKG